MERRPGVADSLRQALADPPVGQFRLLPRHSLLPWGAGAFLVWIPMRRRAKKTPALLTALCLRVAPFSSAFRCVPESDFGCVYALRTNPNEIAPLFLMSFEKQT